MSVFGRFDPPVVVCELDLEGAGRGVRESLTPAHAYHRPQEGDERPVKDREVVLGLEGEGGQPGCCSTASLKMVSPRPCKAAPRRAKAGGRRQTAAVVQNYSPRRSREM